MSNPQTSHRMTTDTPVMQDHVENLAALSVSKRLELARRTGMHVSPLNKDSGKREAAIRIARALVADLCDEVRETLAFELRSCRDLPKSIVTRIACDKDDIAVPFLRVSPALTDTLAAEIVPLLSDNGHLALSVRADIGDQTSLQILRHGNQNAALALIGNPCVDANDMFAQTLLDHFENHAHVLDALAKRPELPMSVIATIVGKVSAHFRDQLTSRYRVNHKLASAITSETNYDIVWRQIRHAGPSQIHAHVIDLRSSGRLTPELTIAMAERGCSAFMESALALESGHTLLEVREALHLCNCRKFVALMRDAGIDEGLAPRFLKLARRAYSGRRDHKQVGRPRLWQVSAATSPAQAS